MLRNFFSAIGTMLILYSEVSNALFELTLCVANPNDFIEVKFDTTTVDNPVGLHSYMNTMLNTNDDVIRY